MKETALSDTLARTIIKNTLFVTLGSVALKLLNFAFSIYVVRRLGDDRFGQYSIVLAFTGLFSIFAELGMTQFAMREIAQDRSKTGSLLGNLMALRLVLALVAIIGITLGAAAVGYPDELVLGIFLHTIGYLLSAIAVPMETVLNANERLDYVTAQLVLGQLTFVVLGALFLLSGLGYVWLIVAGLVSILPQIGLNAWVVHRHRLMSFRVHIDPRLWFQLMRSGLPFGVISLALTIAFSIDTVMLSMFQPDYVVGWYNVAYHLVRSISLFLGGFSVAIIPTLSKTYVDNVSEVEQWYHRSVKVIILLTLPIAVGGALVAFPLIRFLYTDDFLPSALALQILIWDLPLLMFTGFCGNITTVIRQEKAAARIYTLNALANILLNLYTIPRYGLVGAALVTVITDLVGALQFHFLLRRRLHQPDMTFVLARIIIAALLMGGLVWQLNGLHMFVQIALGGLVYLGLVVLFRLLDESEWSLIQRVLHRAVHFYRPKGLTHG